MAVSFLNREVSDLCLGKPALRWISVDATVSEALTALKRSQETYLSVWKCADESCICVGKICTADVICFLCIKENLANPFKALEDRVSEILPKGASIVRHLDPKSSLLEAIDCILEGAQNLVIPIQNQRSTYARKKFFNKPSSYCWITQEDVVRFLLNSIGVFSPIPTSTIESLNIIDRDIMTVHYHDPASSALNYISRALAEQTSVAVVDDEDRIIGEISPFALACCDETAAAAIATLSAGDLMAYIDYGGPPEDLVETVKMRLEERNFGAMLELMEECSHSTMLSSCSSCSSEDEFRSVSGSGSSTRHGKSGRYFPARSSEAILCNPRSSLVAVMIQALAHRVCCVWVVEEDHTLVGAVTLTGMLKVFRSVAGDHKQERDNFFRQ
ncbi:CBS domain-containing protein CBSX5 [Forsythia ovata]|uniref:CBS domain-containing protein CBSX5 n=1 Tax=Forsythia ovata TaxID=205694 RepID=A0ABD1R8B6_9LAMI